MPDMAMPRPNTPPIRKAETSLFMVQPRDQVADDVDGDERRRHEGRHRDERARRQPGDAADAVAARAAIAEMDADADQHAAEDQRAGRDRNAEGDLAAGEQEQQRRDDRACQKRRAPLPVRRERRNDAGQDAGHAGDAAVQTPSAEQPKGRSARRRTATAMV